MKHTPGPWHVAGHPWNIVSADDHLVASAQFGGYTPSSKERDEVAANARLIAAAPDLLAACEAFLRCPSVGSDGPGSTTIVVQDFNLRAARDAVAQAKGGA